MSFIKPFIRSMLTPLLGVITLIFLAPPLHFASSQPVVANETDFPAGKIYPQQGGNLLFGQRHAYTVVFRNDGAATVLGRIVFKNTEQEAIQELSLTISEIDPRDSVFYQVIAPPHCIEYAASPAIGLERPPCLRYSTDYLYDHFQDLGNEDYRKLSPGREGTTFTIPLSQAVKANEAGSIVFAFRAKEYTQSTWAGAYRFTFTSPKIDAPLELVRVSVGVDSDLYLKGYRTKVAYREQFAAPHDLSAPSIGRVIDDYQHRGFTKEGRNLGRGESLVVGGTYADAWWKLYPLEIVGAVGGLLAFVLLWLLWRRFYHPIHQKAGPLTGIFSPANVGVAFASALATVGLTYIVSILIPNYIFPYRDAVSGALFMILVLGLYAAVIFGPALWVAFGRVREGKERAWKHFLFILFVELLFLAVLLAIYVSIVPRPGDIPVPLTGRAEPETGLVE